MRNEHSEFDLVSIGTVGNPTEGAMIREYFAGNDILCTVQGEHHRSMVAFGGAIELSLLVPRGRADEAVDLLRAFREGTAAEALEDNDEPGPASQADDSGDRRRRTRAARMLALLVPGIGLGHFSVGAPVRGFLLLTAWPAAVLLLSRMGAAALALPAIATMLDLVALPPPRSVRRELPLARALRQKS